MIFFELQNCNGLNLRPKLLGSHFLPKRYHSKLFGALLAHTLPESKDLWALDYDRVLASQKRAAILSGVPRHTHNTHRKPTREPPPPPPL